MYCTKNPWVFDDCLKYSPWAIRDLDIDDGRISIYKKHSANYIQLCTFVITSEYVYRIPNINTDWYYLRI